MVSASTATEVVPLLRIMAHLTTPSHPSRWPLLSQSSDLHLGLWSETFLPKI